MQFKHITRFDELLALEDDWRDLQLRSINDSLPLSFDWIRAWWTVFGSERCLSIVCGIDDGRLVAIAPLTRQRSRYRGLPTDTMSLMMNMHTPFSDVLLDQGLTPSLKVAFFKQLINWCPAEILQLTGIRIDGAASHAAHEAARQCGRNVGELPNLITPVVVAESDWDSFFLSRSRKFRKGLRNKLNRFEREGFRVEHVIIGKHTERYLQEIIQVSASSWKAGVKTDLASSEKARSFIEELLTRFAVYGLVHLWMAYDGNRPFAFELHIVHGTVTYPVRADFDEAYRHFAPGSVVEYMALKFAFDSEDLRCYHSCADNYAYLQHWTDHSDRFCDIEIFADTVKSKFLYTVEYRVMPLVRTIRFGMRGVIGRNRKSAQAV